MANNYKRLNAIGTFPLGTGTAKLEAVNITTASGSSNVVTIREAASSKVIAYIDGTAKGSYVYNIGNLTGLVVVIATGTACDMTISGEW